MSYSKKPADAIVLSDTVLEKIISEAREHTSPNLRHPLTLDAAISRSVARHFPTTPLERSTGSNGYRTAVAYYKEANRRMRRGLKEFERKAHKDELDQAVRAEIFADAAAHEEEIADTLGEEHERALDEALELGGHFERSAR